MLLYQQIYTSAEQILEGGSAGNLGIVAKTRGFPGELQGDLAGRQGYTMLPGLATDDVSAHPPRLIVTTQSQRLCISQVAFAGADHTGRTTPLAHHLVLAVQPGEQPASTADEFRAAAGLLRRRWDGPPAYLEPLSLPKPTSAPLPSGAWTTLLEPSEIAVAVSRAAELLVDFQKTKRPVLFVVPRTNGGSVAEMLADVLAVLPRSTQGQLTAVSHIVEVHDDVRGAAILFTYPETAFLNNTRARQDPRAPLILDLTKPDQLAGTPARGYGQAIDIAWNAPDRAAAIRSVTDEWEVMAPPNGVVFAQAIALRDRMEGVSAPAELDELAALSGPLATNATVAARVTTWTISALQEKLPRLESRKRWEATARLAFDERWSSAVNEAARAALRSHPEDAIAVLVPLISGGGGGKAAEREINAILRMRPTLVTVALERIVGAAGADASVPALMLVHSGDQPLAVALRWADLALAASPNHRVTLLARAIERVSDAAVTDSDLETLVAHGSPAEHNGDFGRQVVVPILHQRLRQAREGGWPGASARLISASLQMGVEQDQLHWLLQNFRGRVTRNEVQAWRQAADAAGNSQRFDAAIRHEGLQHFLAPVPAAPVEELRTTDIVPDAVPHSRPLPRVRPRELPSQRLGVLASLTSARSCLLLSVLAILLAAPEILALVAKDVPGITPFGWLQFAVVASTAIAVFAWVTLELALRTTRLSSSMFGMIRIARTILFMLLLMTVILNAWAVFHAAPKQDPPHRPRSTTSRIARGINDSKWNRA